MDPAGEHAGLERRPPVLHVVVSADAPVVLELVVHPLVLPRRDGLRRLVVVDRLDDVVPQQPDRSLLGLRLELRVHGVGRLLELVEMVPEPAGDGYVADQRQYYRHGGGESARQPLPVPAVLVYDAVVHDFLDARRLVRPGLVACARVYVEVCHSFSPTAIFTAGEPGRARAVS